MIQKENLQESSWKKMNLLIIIIVTVLYAVIIGWTWSSLGDIERKKKILITGIGILLVYLITLLLFNKMLDWQMSIEL